MRRFVVLVGLIMMLAMACIAAMHRFGRASSDESMIGYLADHVRNVAGRWCWKDICPKQTQFNQAREQVETNGEIILQNSVGLMWLRIAPETHLYFDSNDGEPTSPIAVISIDMRSRSMSLGDAYQLFGTPIAIRRDAENRPVWHRSVCFSGGLCAYFEGTRAKISPHMRLTNLSLYGTDEVTLSWVYQRWYGFADLPLK